MRDGFRINGAAAGLPRKVRGWKGTGQTFRLGTLRATTFKIPQYGKNFSPKFSKPTNRKAFALASDPRIFNITPTARIR